MTRRTLLVLVLLASAASADDAVKTASPSVTPPEPPGPTVSTRPWWSIPRRGREVIRQLAARQDAHVTRCVAISQEGKVTYEVHARRGGLLGLGGEDFVLTSVEAPKGEEPVSRWWSPRRWWAR